MTLTVNPTVEAGRPVRVDWTREETDPGHFDLRFILDGEDIGVVAASVLVGKDVTSGTTRVTFPSEGCVSRFVVLEQYLQVLPFVTRSFVLAAMGPRSVC